MSHEMKVTFTDAQFAALTDKAVQAGGSGNLGVARANIVRSAVRAALVHKYKAKILDLPDKEFAYHVETESVLW